MEIPSDPLILQQRFAVTELENAQLHNQVAEQDDTIIGLRRTVHGKDAKIKVLQDRADGVLEHDEAVVQLAEANATIVESEFDVQHTLSVRGVLRQIIRSYRQLRITTALQQNAVVEAMIGRLQAEGERDAAVQERDAMRQEKDEALEQAGRTNALRTLYEQGIERSRIEVENAKQSEAAAWAKADELSIVHAQNEVLLEENESLRLSEAQARESEAASRAKIEPLQAELEATQTQLSQTEAELAEVRALLTIKERETAQIVEDLRVELDRTKDEKDRLAQQAKALKTERDRLKSQVNSQRKGKDRGDGFRFFWQH